MHGIGVQRVLQCLFFSFSQMSQGVNWNIFYCSWDETSAQQDNMQRHKSQGCKTCSACAGLRGMASFIGGLVGRETLKVVTVYTLCSDVDVRNHIGFMSACAFSSSPCIFRDLLESHRSMVCKRYILKVQPWEAFTARSVLFPLLFFYFRHFCWGPRGCTGWQVENPKMASVLLTNGTYQKEKKAAKTVWKMTQVKTQQNCRSAQCSGWLFLLVYSPQASDSLWRHSAVHSAECDAGDWTD